LISLATDLLFLFIANDILSPLNTETSTKYSKR
jgi:hypothetical protein